MEVDDGNIYCIEIELQKDDSMVQIQAMVLQ